MTKMELLRRLKGWTQADLAEKAGLNRATIGSIEAGEQVPRLDTATALAVALGCQERELLEEVEHV